MCGCFSRAIWLRIPGSRAQMRFFESITEKRQRCIAVRRGGYTSATLRGLDKIALAARVRFA